MNSLTTAGLFMLIMVVQILTLQSNPVEKNYQVLYCFVHGRSEGQWIAMISSTFKKIFIQTIPGNLENYKSALNIEAFSSLFLFLAPLLVHMKTIKKFAPPLNILADIHRIVSFSSLQTTFFVHPHWRSQC